MTDLSPSLLTEDDLYLFNEGSHFNLYDKLGAHVTVFDGVAGTQFSVWAPNARLVAVIGDFNGWDTSATRLAEQGVSGIWTGFVPGVGVGDVYKYRIFSNVDGFEVDKADPFGFDSETPPSTASKVGDLRYQWNDSDWMAKRGARQTLKSPISVYEMHFGSWRRVPEDDNRSLTYREMAPLLADYVSRLGYTHVEFMPLTAHPFAGSWGYQTVGYFAPDSRFGRPAELMYLIDYLHNADIGIILDWVPSHFPSDEHGLIYFDGTHLFEHGDPREGYHPDWNSYIFNLGRNEVRSFMISSALFWLDKYHIDGLRVDAVASMLYRDYSRKEGEWIPNKYGGRENLENIEFLRRFNTEVYRQYPDVQTIAEESTSWPMVSKPTYLGGLGFGFKWDMGWMHDTLDYFSREAVYRSYHQGEITFRMLYAFDENFLLPLSHDEVTHGKGSLLTKMTGDDWQKFANLRLLYGYMYAMPAKKLLFMGSEFGQWTEWNHDSSLDWHLVDEPAHVGIQRWITQLNEMMIDRPALHELDCDPRGFEWIDQNDSQNSVLSFLRKSSDGDSVLVVCNFTPVPRDNYRVGVDGSGFWRELANGDAVEYGGSGVGNLGGVESVPVRWHGRNHSIVLTLPPLAVLFLELDPEHTPDFEDDLGLVDPEG